MKSILVVYHSRTGCTSALARQISNACNTDLESIKDIRIHTHGFSYLRSALESAFHFDTINQRVMQRPDDYELLVIGTPVWCWNIASPVRAYIKKFQPRFKQVAFFCTYAGSGQTKVLRDMERLSGKRPIATLAVAGSEQKNELHIDRLASFIERLEVGGTSHATSTSIGTHRQGSPLSLMDQAP